MIQIFLENCSCVCLAYDVSLDSSISTLKAAIEQEEGIPVAQQCLKFEGQELEDTRIFSSYSISDGSIVHLGRKPKTIFVRLITGRTVTSTVDLYAPVRVMEMDLQDRVGLRADEHRLVYCGMTLESDRTFTDYNIYEEATLDLKLNIRGGEAKLAYAMACCPWDGDMNHRCTKGLKLSHRGMVVVITGKRDKDWYSAREPDLGPESEGVVPCHFVHIVKDLNDTGFGTATNVSEAKEIEALGLNNPPQDLPIVPEGPLPPFRYPWAEPRIFSRAFANSGHSVLEICITYNPEAVPGEPNILNITLKCLAFDDRISEVSIQVSVPNAEILDVQSPSPMVPAWREGEMQVKLSTRNEQKSGINAGLGGSRSLNVSHGDTSVTGEERSGTVPNTQMSITGHSLRGNTASWSIKEGATVMGGAGLPAELSDMSFTINRQPEAFGFDCLVKVGKGKKYYLKSTWGSSLWYKLLHGLGL